jgi:pyridinium-3,5-biscarboxylic acid mononucleotide sulfurtransferase
MRMSPDDRYRQLLDSLSRLDTAAVAFSGGADSTLILRLARDAIGSSRVVALTVVTPYMVRQEIGDAVALCEQLGVRQELIEMPMPDGIEGNPPDRCYRCKRAMFERLLDAAAEHGHRIVLDGSNLDDTEDYRPGLRALDELGVRSPLIECGIGKEAVRAIARSLGLPTSEKPSNACLLTRLPYNRQVTMDRLQQIEEAERFLNGRGYRWVRVRLHDEALARIEVAPEQRRRLLDEAEEVVAALSELGFRYVTMDLVGYHLGSMNAGLE